MSTQAWPGLISQTEITSKLLKKAHFRYIIFLKWLTSFDKNNTVSTIMRELHNAACRFSGTQDAGLSLESLIRKQVHVGCTLVIM